MLKRRSLYHSSTALALLIAALCAASRAEEPNAIPAALKPWKCADYPHRYYIKVEAPGEAGNAGLHADSMFASLTMPLQISGGRADGVPEKILLIGEDGVPQPVFVHSVAGSSETEIVFATYPGHRRFCLYSGAANPPALFSPPNLHPTSLLVHLKGMTTSPAFKAFPGANGKPAVPLTLERFIQEEERIPPLTGTRTISNPDPHPEIQPNIDDAECPYFTIILDTQDRIVSTASIINPINYAALYEGFLRCPVMGKYKFAIDTPGVAHLIIDGVPVLAAETPDDNREPFALNKTIELSAGIHRVVVHYAESNLANNASGKRTNADFRRFGLRLHWQPPFSSGLLCIPPLAFVKYLPGVVTACENLPDAKPAPFIHIETIGHVRAGAQKGDKAAREWVLAMAKATALPAGARLRANAAGMDDVAGLPGESVLCAWVLAGTPVEFQIDRDATSKRAVIWPTLLTGVKEFLEREVMDLEGELVVKSAPEFLYPNETGHIHVESISSPKPVIVHKSRFDVKDFIALPNPNGWEVQPPMPRPMGEFALSFEQTGTEKPGRTDYAVTPDASERKKIRVSFAADQDQALQGKSELLLRFVVGGVECQRDKFRILHARAPSWPGKLVLQGGNLFFAPNDAGGELNRVVILVPHENEATYRILKPLDRLAIGTSSDEALFLGDPLVEGALLPGQPNGLAAALAKAKPNLKWKSVETAGPHRYRPVLRMLADLDAFVAAAPGTKLPKTAVLSLGTGDVARQTPLHTFERALDTILARLQAVGVEEIVLVGVIPEPWREKQCEPYQERVTNVINQHHLKGGVDLFHIWTNDSNWVRRFSVDGESGDIAGPVPNAAALEEIVKLILARM